VDGPLKVTGKAQYASDFHFPGLLYGVPVEATIANGKVVKLDTAAAEKMPNVRAIFHRGNIGKIFRSVRDRDSRHLVTSGGRHSKTTSSAITASTLRWLSRTRSRAAKAAADAVRVTYAKEKPNVDTDLKADDEPDSVPTTFAPAARLQSKRGDAEAPSLARQSSSTRPTSRPRRRTIPSSCTPRPPLGGLEADALRVNAVDLQHAKRACADVRPAGENVRVVTKFLGSGFGGKLWPWTHCPLAVAAAKQLGKPVKVVVSRKMMFQTVGHRPRTQQRVRLGATQDGKLVSLQHDYVFHHAILDDYHEDCGESTSFLYSVPNLRVAFGRARRNVGSPTSMRGPGAVPGVYATESALNELAQQLKMDPVKLRVLNEPKMNEAQGIPFSSRHMLECFEMGAEKFGWSRRTPEVGSMKRDGLILGWGMAGCTWFSARFPAEASVQLRDDGTVRVACGTQDIGTGTYTNLAQIASQKIGVPLDRVEAALGDTILAPGPISGGSLTTSSVIPAVIAAADNAIGSLLNIATSTPGSPFEKRKRDDLALEGGKVFVKADGPGSGVPFADILRRGNLRLVTGNGKSEATFGKPNPKVSTNSYGAHFVEVTWQPEIARLRISRVVSVIDAGRILNPLAGRNQIEGAVVMGIGMALFEQTHYDPQTGAPSTATLPTM
jgi:xanthine dehydrogenase YagR molybdenum-binding subunit